MNETAKRLQESGLFDRKCDVCQGKGAHCERPETHFETCYNCKGSGIATIWPDADTSEAILAEMGLQVVWNDTDQQFFLGQLWNHHTEDGRDIVVAWDDHEALPECEKGMRTLANNAALAWLTENRKPELKQALIDLGYLEEKG